MREKTDKFQQRRLDGFFKAGAKAADQGDAVEEAEPPAMPEIMAMEVEMEVFICPVLPLSADLVSLSLQTQHPSHGQPNVPFNPISMLDSTQFRCPFKCRPVSLSSPFSPFPFLQYKCPSTRTQLVLSCKSPSLPCNSVIQTVNNDYRARQFRASQASYLTT